MAGFNEKSERQSKVMVKQAMLKQEYPQSLKQGQIPGSAIKWQGSKTQK